MRDLVDACENFSVGPALIFKNEVDLVGRPFADHVEQRTEGRRELRKDATGSAENFGLGDLKWHAGAGEHRHCLIECHTHGHSLPTTVGGDATGQKTCFATGR
ncbi:unannotated protein [freshwater metagenome]|uniref:Unannotated protein n=1 Tax=freshwater metagenome TaxID=449393 RepID=A0A6J6J867_9ZZZZ